MMFRNKEVKLPQPHSIKVLSYAARFRTASETCTVWRTQKEELDSARGRYGPLSWLIRHEPNMPGWQLKPAADLLADASHEFGSDLGPFKAEVSNICKEKNIHAQKATSLVLLPRLYPINIPAELARRLMLWFSDTAPPWDLAASIAQTLAVSQKMKPSITLSFVKVLCNGIPTSFRTHSAPVRRCLFGCVAQDRISHYIFCPVLWNVLFRAIDFSSCLLPANVLALYPPETPWATIFNALLAVHTLVDAVQNLLGPRRNVPLLQIKDSLRRAKILLARANQDI